MTVANANVSTADAMLEKMETHNPFLIHHLLFIFILSGGIRKYRMSTSNWCTGWMLDRRQMRNCLSSYDFWGKVQELLGILYIRTIAGVDWRGGMEGPDHSLLIGSHFCDAMTDAVYFCQSFSTCFPWMQCWLTAKLVICCLI